MRDQERNWISQHQRSAFTKTFRNFALACWIRVKHINAENDNIYYRLESNLLKVFSSARIYTFDGKQICSLTDNSQIDTGTLPDFFIIKFNDGKTFKLQK